MKLSMMIMFCLIFQGLCFAQDVPFFKDSLNNQKARLEIANTNLHEVYYTLSVIKQITHEDPDRACDLISDACNYLINAKKPIFMGNPDEVYGFGSPEICFKKLQDIFGDDYYARSSNRPN